MIKELLYEEKDGVVSHTKFWSNVGYFLMCWAFIFITTKMILKDPFPMSEWVEMFIVFGGFVTGSRAYSKWIMHKSGKKCDEAEAK
jgi:hypothetical protein